MKQNNRLKRQTLAFAMGLSLLASCSSTETTSPQETSSSGGSGEASPSGSAEKLSIVTTTFPEYDWVREILGDQIDSYNLTLLIDNGVDLHSFNFDFDDVILIGEADLFLHNGGESVSLWVDDVLDQVQDSSVKTINLLESIGSHGVDAPHFHYDDVEEEHDHDHEEEEHDHDHEEEEHDHDHEEEE
ncbi:MAG: metal ABC transporter substrate-binding protein, partial [Eubacteriales bacterium]